MASLVRVATAWPALLLLGSMTLFGVGSRIVLGYLSPGAYAEEVIAARTFLANGMLYSTGSDPNDKWPGGMDARVPWDDVPLVTPCQANALANRARFYSEHAHTPMLLLAGVPVVRGGGGRALYLVLVALTLSAIVVMWRAALGEAAIAWRSRSGLLALIALGGWQPVLAGIRHGDAVIAASGAMALAWMYGRNREGNRVRTAVAAAAAAVGAAMAVPAIGTVAALLRVSVRRGAAALGALAALVVLTLEWAGPGTAEAYLATTQQAVRTYAGAIPNYAVGGRLLAGGGAWLFLGSFAGIAALSWWRARTPDAAFAVFPLAGLLAAPIVWSQHLAIAFVPAIVLLRVAARGTALALAGWASLILFLSLPDGAVILLARALPPLAGGATPIVAVVLTLLWVASVWCAGAPRTTADAAYAAAQPVRVLP